MAGFTDVWQSFTPSLDGYLLVIVVPMSTAYGMGNTNSSAPDVTLTILAGEGTAGRPLYSTRYLAMPMPSWRGYKDPRYLSLPGAPLLLRGRQYTFRLTSTTPFMLEHNFYAEEASPQYDRGRSSIFADQPEPWRGVDIGSLTITLAATPFAARAAASAQNRAWRPGAAILPVGR